MTMDRRGRPFDRNRIIGALLVARGALVLAGIADVIPASAQGTAPEGIISEVSADWNGDGSLDKAYLKPTDNEEDQVDLVIELSGGTNGAGTTLIKRGIVWQGAMAGTQPSLLVNERGSLIVTSENDSIGRDRWRQKLTIIYRNQTFIIAGFTYVSRDTLDPGAGVNCDANFLSGRGARNGKPIRLSSKPVTLADWSDSDIPKECQIDE